MVEKTTQKETCFQVKGILFSFIVDEQERWNYFSSVPGSYQTDRRKVPGRWFISTWRDWILLMDVYGVIEKRILMNELWFESKRCRPPTVQLGYERFWNRWRKVSTDYYAPFQLCTLGDITQGTGRDRLVGALASLYRCSRRGTWSWRIYGAEEVLIMGECHHITDGNLSHNYAIRE